MFLVSFARYLVYNNIQCRFNWVARGVQSGEHMHVTCTSFYLMSDRPVKCIKWRKLKELNNSVRPTCLPLQESDNTQFHLSSSISSLLSTIKASRGVYDIRDCELRRRQSTLKQWRLKPKCNGVATLRATNAVPCYDLSRTHEDWRISPQQAGKAPV